MPDEESITFSIGDLVVAPRLLTGTRNDEIWKVVAIYNDTLLLEATSDGWVNSYSSQHFIHYQE